MKRFILLAFAVTLMVSCNSGPKAGDESFDWLLGKWERTNEKEGTLTIELWSKLTDSEYAGFGATLQDGDTLWYENIKLVKSNNLWNFEVTGQGESSPTVFQLTGIEKGRFTSENDQNEFPKKIEYFRSGNGLKALISGGEMEIKFDFKRISP